MMLCHIVHFYRSECTKPHMQRNIGNDHAFFLQFFEQFIGKMKSGCRRSRRSVVFGIHGLIPVFIFQFMGNIRWKRHLSKLIQNFLENSLVGKPDQTVSVLQHIDDLAFQKSFSKRNTGTGPRLFPGFYQCFPDVIFFSF
ncbi:unknown [Roseburia sp. CAG:309]|nr:unknown [Roseburia sp. CAG:309]